MDLNKVASAIIAADSPQGATCESQLLDGESWPDWATHAVHYQDIHEDDLGEKIRSSRVRYFPSEAEYYAWAAESFRLLHALGGTVKRRVTTYDWYLGPGCLGTRDLTSPV